jgi:hypothetical protein
MGVVQVVTDKGFDKAIFVSDCLSVIQRINSPTQDRSQVGSRIKNIKTLVAGFSFITFWHVHRSLNEAEHILARFCNLDFVGFISYFAPDCIRKTLCIDVMNQ